MPRTVIADTVKSALLVLLRNVLVLTIGGGVAALAWFTALTSLCGLRSFLLLGGLPDLGGLH